jgi:CheY-like chemotaxis protein
MLRVLIIETVEGEARDIANRLCQLRHGVTIVRSGPGALAALGLRPHLAVLSLRKSLTDGIMAMQFIRSRAGLDEIPIVIQAGPTAIGQIAIAKRAGAAGVLIEGRYEPADVRDMVEELCGTGLAPAARG